MGADQQMKTSTIFTIFNLAFYVEIAALALYAGIANTTNINYIIVLFAMALANVIGYVQGRLEQMKK
jgi:hypothetical protein